jgi:predicted HicB family RNase H-like nuclease
MDPNVRYIKKSIPKELWMQARLQAFSEKKTITTWIAMAMCEKLGVKEILFKELGHKPGPQSIPKELWTQARSRAVSQGETITAWIARAMKEKLEREGSKEAK